MKIFLLVYFAVMVFLLFFFGLSLIIFDEHEEQIAPKDVVASIVLWPLTILTILLVVATIAFECFFGNTPNKSKS